MVAKIKNCSYEKSKNSSIGYACRYIKFINLWLMLKIQTT